MSVVSGSMVDVTWNGMKFLVQNWCWILSNRIPGASKINPRGSQGHQNSCSGALRAASWVAMAYLGRHWDNLRAHPATLELHPGPSGNHFDALGGCFGQTKPPFWGHRGASWPYFFDLAAVLLKIRKSWKNLGFSMVFQWFQGSGEHQNQRKIDEKSVKIEPGARLHTKNTAGIGRIACISCISGKCVPK